MVCSTLIECWICGFLHRTKSDPLWILTIDVMHTNKHLNNNVLVRTSIWHASTVINIWLTTTIRDMNKYCQTLIQWLFLWIVCESVWRVFERWKWNCENWIYIKPCNSRMGSCMQETCGKTVKSHSIIYSSDTINKFTSTSCYCLWNFIRKKKAKQSQRMQMKLNPDQESNREAENETHKGNSKLIAYIRLICTAASIRLVFFFFFQASNRMPFIHITYDNL